MLGAGRGDAHPIAVGATGHDLVDHLGDDVLLSRGQGLDEIAAAVTSIMWRAQPGRRPGRPRGACWCY